MPSNISTEFRRTKTTNVGGCHFAEGKKLYLLSQSDRTESIRDTKTLRSIMSPPIGTNAMLIVPASTIPLDIQTFFMQAQKSNTEIFHDLGPNYWEDFLSFSRFIAFTNFLWVANSENNITPIDGATVSLSNEEAGYHAKNKGFISLEEVFASLGTNQLTIIATRKYDRQLGALSLAASILSQVGQMKLANEIRTSGLHEGAISNEGIEFYWHMYTYNFLCLLLTLKALDGTLNSMDEDEEINYIFGNYYSRIFQSALNIFKALPTEEKKLFLFAKQGFGTDTETTLTFNSPTFLEINTTGQTIYHKIPFDQQL